MNLLKIRLDIVYESFDIIINLLDIVYESSENIDNKT